MFIVKWFKDYLEKQKKKKQREANRNKRIDSLPEIRRNSSSEIENLEMRLERKIEIFDLTSRRGIIDHEQMEEIQELKERIEEKKREQD